MRHLATIREISSIAPIVGKDRVELATVDGWTCMVSKADNFKAGSLCIFCEPDSVFPATEQWEFLKKYNYRIKTQKFKDGNGNPIYSQGLVLPTSTVVGKVKLYDDVTSLLGITQYEPPMDKEPDESWRWKNKWWARYGILRKLFMPKKQSNAFPKFISKTDEERIQNCPSMLEYDRHWIATEKVDGQSGSFAVVKHKTLFGNKYEFIVCSRNLRKNIPDNSSYWFVAKKYHIKEQLIRYLKENPTLDWVVIQGECVAPNVQGNKYKVSEPDLYVFNFITSKDGRLSSSEARIKTNCLKMKFVPIIDYFVTLKGKEVNEVLAMANGKSALYDTLREGIVFRTLDGKLSFKAVSPEFLIKHNE